MPVKKSICKFTVGAAYANSRNAYRRFEPPSFWDESYEVALEMLRHRFTTHVLFLMFALGFSGWVFTYLI